MIEELTIVVIDIKLPDLIIGKVIDSGLFKGYGVKEYHRKLYAQDTTTVTLRYTGVVNYDASERISGEEFSTFISRNTFK